MTIKSLTALPVFNERAHVGKVLDETLRYSRDVLVVNDGSTDGTSEVLAARKDIHVLTHGGNRGYGAALKSAFDYAICQGYDVLVTIDCDGQHEPKRIPELVAATRRADIVSGSRYLAPFPGDSLPPEQRQRVNRIITEEINRRLGLHLTDAFCGFKAYRVGALRRIEVTDPGYAMPLELWVQAAFHRLRILEVAVPLIYLDETRSFGGSLDDTSTRLAVYRDVLERAIGRCFVAGGGCPSTAASILSGNAPGLQSSKFSTAGSACGETL